MVDLPEGLIDRPGGDESGSIAENVLEGFTRSPAGACWLCRPTDQDSNVESKECLALFRMLVF
jgi:hypothetical protein